MTLDPKILDAIAALESTDRHYNELAAKFAETENARNIAFDKCQQAKNILLQAFLDTNVYAARIGSTVYYISLNSIHRLENVAE